MKYTAVAIGLAAFLGLATGAVLLMRSSAPEPALKIEETPLMATSDRFAHCLGYHRFVLPADFTAMPGQSAEIDQLKIRRLAGQAQAEAAFLRAQTEFDDLGEPIQSQRINGWLMATYKDANAPDRIVHLLFVQRFGEDMVIARKSGSISRIGRYEDPLHHRFARETRISELTSPTQSGFCVEGLVLSGYRIGTSAQVAAAYGMVQDGQEVVLGIGGLLYDRVDMGRLPADTLPAGGETEQIDGVDVRREPIVWSDRTGILTTTEGSGEDPGWIMDLDFAPVHGDPHPPGIRVTLDRPPMSVAEGRRLLLDTLGSFELRTPPW